MINSPRIFVALDYPNIRQAENFISKVTPNDCGLKIGKELFICSGPDYVRKLVDQGYQVFLDLKIHDIPNQVAGAVRSIAELGVAYFTVHALGGPSMLAAALDSLSRYRNPPILLAVTILTSLNQEELNKIGISQSLEQTACQLVALAYQEGVRGFVCSALELAQLKLLAPEACFVTPGIRLDLSNKHDQSRIMTPLKAYQAGADYLVIGRSITETNDPLKTLTEINHSLEGVVK